MIKPTMQVWTNAWHTADADTFKQLYAELALIFPPGKKTVQGNTNILDFMKGGLGKVDVLFEREQLIISENLAFEYGRFRDMERSGDTVLGEGTYGVTWIWEDNEWKIQSHTWSMPASLPA
ncbi:MAG: nuclear transport factor 2 family protein [Bacteroidetes bacterium]|nr:nuclear transport factor 2 family protein [Bacteroidota bacterium]